MHVQTAVGGMEYTLLLAAAMDTSCRPILLAVERDIVPRMLLLELNS